MREFGSPLVDDMKPTPYAGMQGLFGPAFPWGNRNYWKSSFLRALPDAAVEAVVEHADRGKSPLSAVALEYYGSAASRVATDATAFPHRQATYNLLVLGQWSDATEDPVHIGARLLGSGPPVVEHSCLHECTRRGQEREGRARCLRPQLRAEPLPPEPEHCAVGLNGPIVAGRSAAHPTPNADGF